ncbi:unnamed protein product [Bursaphelenchus xylophilus]|uniref:(pine wood nematode) hypothetical protein n=1 Tax=Bursaphelenchus xylophilus TaxID=6326 RepID=A0A1I7RVQ9_BURXY|nr:unnamed protein product [Bursaphelenchus xylophilus]CAG9082024.1 unnamed protein product [Bursaphelenchus xylophilus]
MEVFHLFVFTLSWVYPVLANKGSIVKKFEGTVRCKSDGDLNGKGRLTFLVTILDYKPCRSLEIWDRITGKCANYVYQNQFVYEPKVDVQTGRFVASYNAVKDNAEVKGILISHECNNYCLVHNVTNFGNLDNMQITLGDEESGDKPAYSFRNEGLYFCNGEKY